MLYIFICKCESCVEKTMKMGFRCSALYSTVQCHIFHFYITLERPESTKNLIKSTHYIYQTRAFLRDSRSVASLKTNTLSVFFTPKLDFYSKGLYFVDMFLM